MKQPTAQVTTIISKDDREFIKQLAEREHRSISQTTRILIEQAIKNYNKK